MSDACIDERIAIVRHHGGESKAVAEDAAYTQFGNLTKDDAPRHWKRVNGWWHVLASDVFGDDADAAHDALKSKHGVDSFTELTIGQIWTSIQKLRTRQKEAS